MQKIRDVIVRHSFLRSRCELQVQAFQYSDLRENCGNGSVAFQIQKYVRAASRLGFVI